MVDNDAAGALPICTHGARLAGFIKGITKQMLHTKYKSSGLHGFREEDFFMFVLL